MSSLLIEEEQISLLGKMLYYSANHLTTREREMYDLLIEQLMRKVNQMRTAERIRAAQAEDGLSGDTLKSFRKKEAIRKVSPEQLCRIFVDTWNKQDFETEYLCLASCFPHHKRKAETMDEYVLLRLQKYQKRHAIGPISKRVTEITSSEVHGDKATVYCFEVHKMPDKELTLHREYELIMQDNSWHIADFETVKSHGFASSAYS